MSSQNRALSFTFTTDDKQALAALRRMEKGFKGLDVQVDRTRQTGVNFGNSMAGLALGAGAIFSVKEFEEAEKGMAATEAVIRSTGNAAEVSAGQQAKLADELSRLAGIDDDVVNGGANMLRTFTEIKGENFGLALGASLDYAAFKGQDLASSAELIGKALNDPVAGMSRLTRAGVVLSDQQKELIRDFADAGDTASAQKVILDELEREYGGQAEAAATSSGKMRVAFGEAAESVGAVLAPAMEVGADAAGVAARAFGSLPEPLQIATVGALGLAYAGPKVVDGLSKIGPAASRVGDFLGMIPQQGVGAVSTMTRLSSTVAASPVSMAAGAAGAGVLIAALIELSTQTNYAEQNAKSLVATAESTGKSIDEVFGERLAKTLAGADGGFDLGPTTDKFADFVEQFDIGASELRAAVQGSDADFEAFKEQLREAALASGDTSLAAYGVLEKQLDRLRGAGQKATEQQKDLTDAQKDLGVETKETADVTGDATGKVQDNTAVQGGWLDSINKSRDAWREQADQIERTNEQLDENRAKAGDAFDAEAGYQSALFSLEDAQKAYDEALKTGDPDKVERAQQSLYEAIVRVSEAKVTLAQKDAEARGESLSAADAADIQRGALVSLVDQTGVTNDSIQTLIDRLTLASVRHKIDLQTAEAEENVWKLVSAIWALAEGLAGVGQIAGVGGDLIAQGAQAGIVALSPDTAPDGLRGAGVVVQGDLNVGSRTGLRDFQMEAKRQSSQSAKKVLAA